MNYDGCTYTYYNKNEIVYEVMKSNKTIMRLYNIICICTSASYSKRDNISMVF